MSIDKSILREQIVTMIDCKKDHLTIDYDFLLSLIQQVLFHDPTQDHVIK
ncbi:MAG: hypothetical protein H6766_06650 [Candidatus Peribacteria bacterium]|nr:MAG: hypothetical protein H6766_06650 [Candidatus Peribacteria bacterium]